MGDPLLCLCVQEVYEDRSVEIGAGYTGISVYYETKLVGRTFAAPPQHPLTNLPPAPLPRQQITPGQLSTNCSIMAVGSRSATIPRTTWSTGRSRSTSLTPQRPGGPSASGRSVWSSTPSSAWLCQENPLSPSHSLSHSLAATPSSAFLAGLLHRCGFTTSPAPGCPSHGEWTA